MIKIIICDDHYIVRRGLKLTFSETPDIMVVDEVGAGFELLKKIQEKHYDVVILDVSMPGLDGIDTLKEIKKIKKHLPVLVFTMFSEEQYAIRVIKAGASGFVSKDKNPSEIIDAVRKLADGKKYLSPNLAELLAESVTERNSNEYGTLSDREFQVMIAISQGKSLSEIADELSLSLTTVSTYRSRILEKLNVKSNVEIAHYALKSGLVSY